MYLKGSSSEDQAALFGFIGVATFGIIIGTPLLYGIISFERLGQFGKRTLLNMLSATICWINIWQMVIDRTLEIILFTTGPWPYYLCNIKVGFKVFLISSMALTFNATAVTRYLFIFWIKSPMALNDKFWHKVIVMWITLCTCVLTTVALLGSENKSTIYGICAGTAINPKEQDLPLLFVGALIIASILLHLVIKIRIMIFESNVKLFPKPQLDFYKRAFITAMKKTEMFSFAANFACFSILSAAIVNTMRIKTLTNQTLSSIPNAMTVWFFHLVAPTLFMFTVVISFYRKEAVRKYVFKEIKALVNF